MLIIASGGAGELGTRTTGILVAFGFPNDSSGVPSSDGRVEIDRANVDILNLIFLGIAIVAVAYAVVLRRQRT